MLGATRVLGALLMLGALLGGCSGVQPPDLFAVGRDGDIPGARLELVVTDNGTARCNGAKPRLLPNDLTLSARDITRKVAVDARRGLRLPAGPGSTLRYRLRDADGHVEFADTATARRPELARLAFFVRQAAQRVCGLPR
jgi:hypothetical protein